MCSSDLERIRSILDIPCGDYNWMQHIHRPCTVYHGADIVEPLIKKLKATYENSMTKFKVLDVTTSRLPIVELVIVRDCFVHLTLEQVTMALKNIRNHKPAFILVTTFPDREVNTDIEAGSWRPLNMTKAPFNLKPYKMYKDNEGTSKDNRDKSLMLVKL